MIVKLVARLGFRRYPIPLIFLNKALIFISQNTNDFHYCEYGWAVLAFFKRLFHFVNDEKISGHETIVFKTIILKTIVLIGIKLNYENTKSIVPENDRFQNFRFQISNKNDKYDFNEK